MRRCPVCGQNYISKLGPDGHGSFPCQACWNKAFGQIENWTTGPQRERIVACAQETAKNVEWLVTACRQWQDRVAELEAEVGRLRAALAECKRLAGLSLDEDYERDLANRVYRIGEAAEAATQGDG